MRRWVVNCVLGLILVTWGGGVRADDPKSESPAAGAAPTPAWNQQAADLEERAAAAAGNNDFETALELRSSAVTLLREHGPRSEQLATALNQQALTLYLLGRGSDALPLIEEALEVWRRLHPGDHPDVARGINNVASVLESLGRSADANRAYGEALAMWRRLYEGDHRDVAECLNNFAVTLESLGRSSEALPILEEALAMRRRLYPGDHPDVAQGLGNLAYTLDSLGRTADALPLLEEALAMGRRLHPGDDPDVALDLNNLASALDSLGRSAEAVPLLEEALAMDRRVFPDDHPDRALFLNNLAGALDSLGRTAEALPLYEEALAMFRRLDDGDHPDVALGLNNVALTLGALARGAEALPSAEDALRMWRTLHAGDHPDVALGLHTLAETLDLLGRGAEALPLHEQAYAMSKRLGAPDRWRWGTRLGLALLRADRVRDAVVPLQSAIRDLETIRTDARSLRSEERASFVDLLRKWGDPFALLMRAHVLLGEADDALTVLERGRGREMLDLLLRGEVNPLAKLKERAAQAGDRKMLERIREVEEEQHVAEAEVVQREREGDQARAKPDVALRELRAVAAAESKARRDLLEAMGKRQRLVRDVLPAARPLSAKELRALLAPRERILAYSVSEVASYVFVVSPDGVEVEPLEGERIRQAAQEYAAVLSDGRSDLTAEVVPGGRRLFEAVLPVKTWRAVSTASRLYLMADGPLPAIPFETLVVGEREGKAIFWADAGPPIAYEASGSVLKWLEMRPVPGGGRTDLVAVGDPVFAGNAEPIAWPRQGVLLTEVRPGGQGEKVGLRPGDVLASYDGKAVPDAAALRGAVEAAGEQREDIRVGLLRDGVRKEVLASSGPLGVSLATEAPDVAGPKLLQVGQVAVALRGAEERGKQLTPLPGTRVEVAAIEAEFAKHLGKKARTTVLLGRDATEDALLRATHRPRFLHLATHGLVDETRTASFSSLALTMPAVPVPGDDGFLTLVDLFSRWRGRLDGTELVVLSACRSTKGRESLGEGMYALPWGFLYAGARSVVGSLWNVDDESTAYLFADFYRRLLEGDGRDPLAALSAARLATKAKYPHPHHWGAFVLSGAPR